MRAFLVSLACAGLLAGVNRVENGNLEEPFPTGGLPAGWYTFRSADATYTFERALLGRLDGHSLLLAGSGEHAGAAVVKLPLEPGTRWFGAGWLKTAGELEARLKIDYYAGRKYLGNTGVGSLRGTRDWTDCRLVDLREEFPEADAIGLTVIVYGAGRVWADDLRFEAWPELADQATNRLANGHAESGLGDRPAAWTATRAEDNRADWLAEAAHRGERGLRLTTTSPAAWRHGPVRLEVGPTWRLSGWVRCRAGQARLKLEHTRAGRKVAETVTPTAPADGQWHRLEATVAPAALAQATAAVAVAELTGAGDADFDDLRLAAD